MAGPGPQLKGIRVSQYLLDESPVHSSWCQDTPGAPAIVSTFLQQDGGREGEKADPELEPVTRLCSSMAIFPVRGRNILSNCVHALPLY